MSDLSRDGLDKWLITAMSHMRTLYEDNDIPWSEENEESFQAIRNLILRRVTQEDVEGWAERLSVALLGDDVFSPFQIILQTLIEAGVEFEWKKE